MLALLGRLRFALLVMLLVEVGGLEVELLIAECCRLRLVFSSSS